MTIDDPACRDQSMTPEGAGVLAGALFSVISAFIYMVLLIQPKTPVEEPPPYSADKRPNRRLEACLLVTLMGFIGVIANHIHMLSSVGAERPHWVEFVISLDIALMIIFASVSSLFAIILFHRHVTSD